jgi:UDP-N-acetyl-D-mannosaminuronic acid transferase (WecB/TagA/CpsF family)
MSEEALVPVFIPPLVTVLAQHEREKGSPLTEVEVLAIRGKSVVMMMRQSHADQMAQKRGYRDVDPKRCWVEWQEARKSL